MMEELERAIGFPPILQREDWDPKNMDEYLESLKQKSKIAI